ncbi:MAG: glycoside hydrolase family 3 N-terminal domain-containing protein, partial [Anaerolineales bacterium]
AERVGQLFIVSFYGASAANDTAIYNLIVNYKVGGAILTAANDNITDTLHAPEQVLTITNQLQAAALAASAIPRLGPDPNVPDETLPPYLPLFVAINHEGDGYPYSEIQSGLTPLPDEMAIGATWNPSQAESVGRVAGAELSALGVNMLIGPSLDVLETPRPEGTDLGTRVFGGDPYWVGVMGAAYVRGVHAGASGQVAVIAKHFPGHGGSDRRPEEELPTVRKSLDDLQNFDLVPFYAVTGGAASPASVADGVLNAHIRFQGFQGNIRQNTAPVSFDEQALGQLLGLPPIAAWRAAGGVTVSDSLGARAIKSFYDPTLGTFPNRRITKDAFNAGNDLLLLTDFGLNPRTDQTERIIDTLTGFTQLYLADPNFAAKVDAAVLRILNLKLRLYGGSFSPGGANRPVSGLNVLLTDQGGIPALAQSAAALIRPTLDDLAAIEPPAPTDHIVFFTDVRQGQQCSTCLHYPLFDKRMLEQTVAELYGASGGAQIRATNLQSFSFEELAQYLGSPIPPAVGNETPTPEPAPIEAALQTADWVVFAMQNVTPDVPSSRVVSTFLAQRPEIVRSNKKLIVFAFNAPYYLDTTDITKLTAYYALYSRTQPFVTVAARLLFRDLTPHGAPPVSVHSAGYDLFEVTRPDPRQVITLDWQPPVPPEGATPQAPGLLHLGDTITLTTGVIVDHNGHPVPDQTPVIFRVFYREEGLPETFQVTTVGGVASYPLQLNRAGQLEITVSSDPAVASNQLRITAQEGSAFSVTPVAPTPQPTETATPTATDPPPSATPTSEPTATSTQALTTTSTAVDWRGFFVMALGLFAALVGGYRLGTLDEPQPRLGVRVALAGAIGVLLGYNYFALLLPGAAIAYWWLGALAGPVCAIIGGIFGLAAGWYLFIGRQQKK